MSIVGKSTVSLRKKDVKEQTSGAVGFKKIVFAHKATLGDSGISLGSLVAPSAEMPTHTNPTTNDLLSANLLFFKNNLTLISSTKGVLMLDLSYSISSSSTIRFIDFTADDGEIFIGIIDNVAKSGVNLVDARPIIATGTIAVGVTDFNVGQSFRVNQYPSSQSGDVVVFRNGVQQFRNVGNSPTGEGNYYEVQAGNGLGQLIRFNNPPVSQADSILVMSNGLIAERPDGSMMAVIESLAGQLDKVIPVLSDVSGQPESYFQGAPNDQDLKQFGDQVLDHEVRLDTLENRQSLSVQYNRGTAQSISPLITTVVNFNTAEYDFNNLVTTGANWYFSAPEDGEYELNAFVQFTDSEAWATGTAYYLSLEILDSNGVSLSGKLLDDQFVQAAFTYFKTLKGNASFYLTVGQRVRVTVTHTAAGPRNIRANPACNYINIKKVR